MAMEQQVDKMTSRLNAKLTKWLQSLKTFTSSPTNVYLRSENLSGMVYT